MPTLTLTIDSATLDAMFRGEAVTFTGTLKARKPKADPAPLSDEERMLYQTTVDLYQHHDPAMPIGRAWKSVKKAAGTPDQVAEALSLALDWNKGKAYAPEWFVKDFPEWQRRCEIDLFHAETERDQYRRRLGLGA